MDNIAPTCLTLTITITATTTIDTRWCPIRNVKHLTTTHSAIYLRLSYGGASTGDGWFGIGRRRSVRWAIMLTLQRWYCPRYSIRFVCSRIIYLSLFVWTRIIRLICPFALIHYVMTANTITTDCCFFSSVGYEYRRTSISFHRSKLIAICCNVVRRYININVNKMIWYEGVDVFVGMHSITSHPQHQMTWPGHMTRS